jgi:hypothetical protein
MNLFCTVGRSPLRLIKGALWVTCLIAQERRRGTGHVTRIDNSQKAIIKGPFKHHGRRVLLWPDKDGLVAHRAQKKNSPVIGSGIVKFFVTLR